MAGAGFEHRRQEDEIETSRRQKRRPGPGIERGELVSGTLLQIREEGLNGIPVILPLCVEIAADDGGEHVLVAPFAPPGRIDERHDAIDLVEADLP